MIINKIAIHYVIKQYIQYVYCLCSVDEYEGKIEKEKSSLINALLLDGRVCAKLY